MPLPLGHTAIGIAVIDLSRKDDSVVNSLALVAFIAVLANFPDIDVVIGLLFQGNGNAFHRGPTHSLVFALSMGFVAANAWKLWSQIPRINFTNCFMLILSHVAIDCFLTGSPISFLWPLEVKWAAGYSGWGDIVVPIFLEAYRDGGIIIVCGVIIIFKLVITQARPYVPVHTWHERPDKIRQKA